MNTRTTDEVQAMPDEELRAFATNATQREDRMLSMLTWNLRMTERTRRDGLTRLLFDDVPSTQDETR